MKIYGPKYKILLDQKLITQMVMMKLIWRSNLILDDDLLLNKTLEHRNMIIVVRSVFHECNKYYTQVFLEYYEQYRNDIRIDFSESIDVNKASTLNEWIACYYW